LIIDLRNAVEKEERRLADKNLIKNQKKITADLVKDANKAVIDE